MTNEIYVFLLKSYTLPPQTYKTNVDMQFNPLYGFPMKVFSLIYFFNVFPQFFVVSLNFFEFSTFLVHLFTTNIDRLARYCM